MKNAMPIIFIVLFFGIGNVIFGKMGLLGNIIAGGAGALIGGYIGETFFKDKDDTKKKKFKFFKDISED